MIFLFRDEEFRDIQFPHSFKNNYAISNHGRILSYKTKMEEGRILKPSLVSGFEWFRYSSYVKGKRKNHSFSIHSLVATVFLPPKREEDVFVLHLDYDKRNNMVENLKWATPEEQVAHQQKNPVVIEARRKRIGEHRYKGTKLTETQVRILKKRILDPNRKTRMKLIAKQFGISEMQVYRIKSGENWGHVKV